MVQTVEKDIIVLRPNDQELKERLERFFWLELPHTRLGAVMNEVKPVGGQRKVEALKGFATAQGKCLSHTAVVGDSITDFKMLKAVNDAGGLAIAFNANEYALPYATIGLASTNISDLAPILNAWEGGGREAVEAMVREKEQAGGKGDRGHFHWLHHRQYLAEPLEVHKRIRSIVRQEAGRLG
jgi:energy-converting hydrogenase A subunit R